MLMGAIIFFLVEMNISGVQLSHVLKRGIVVNLPLLIRLVAGVFGVCF